MLPTAARCRARIPLLTLPSFSHAISERITKEPPVQRIAFHNKKVPWARLIAWKTLLDVDAGAHSTDLLDRRLLDLDPRDAHLVTEIVLGTLRRRAQIDWLIEQTTRRPLSKLDRGVLAALRMGAYQLRFLSRVPAHAAIDESVELVKRAGLRSAAGFTNALLRRLPPLPRRWPAPWIEWSLPEWLWTKWAAQFGRHSAAAIAAAALAPPENYVRSAAAAPGLEPAGLPGCYRLTGQLPPGARFQDIGSQSIVPLLELAPHHRFLDVCAAPGNKTLQALETPVYAVACDLGARRLASQLLAGVPRVQLDATARLPFPPVFDRVLVDAPCSGTGTLSRNPEIRWRLQPHDLDLHRERQTAILRNAFACLAPGGRLVYSTCSLEGEENEQVVALSGCGKLLSTMQRIPGREPGEGFFAAVLSSG